jgi:hypothetical protein
MKKTDILVIIIILLLSVGFYALYFSNNQLSGELMIVVYYKNQVIHEQPLNEDTDVIVDIYTEDQKLYVNVGDRGFKHFSHISNVDSRHIENTIRITYGQTLMIHANCEDKLCMNMRIGSRASAPIVCTNGVLIKLQSEEFVIEV